MLDAADEPYQLGRKTIRGRFAILVRNPLHACRDDPEVFPGSASIGVVTTKSISAQPAKAIANRFMRDAPALHQRGRPG
jgi:hypothetical protein